MSAILDAEDVFALGYTAAVAAVRDALAAGLDPDHDVPRSVLALTNGQGLLMPSEAGGWFGVKVATVAPDNAARGQRRINATYLLHDSETLAPAAILDGVALTTLRTPAVSVGASLDRLRVLADSSADGLRLVVFGTGPQGEGHVRTIQAHAPLADVTAVTRRGGATPVWADRHVASDDAAVAGCVRNADVIVTATSACQPVVDGRLVRDSAVVLAVGSHEPSVRELDGVLMDRATVIVESRDVALREAGDVILAVQEGLLDPNAMVTMADLLGEGSAATPADRPTVVKTSGMAWEDLVVAVAAYRQWREA
ncbi:MULTISPECIES: ornithine cyclodeaminase family protein [Streptomyces]|uniref:Ornithine cyclodeaminase family protein n=2 Tax=Streptomyces TaxID=1883 RepID=A0A3R7ELG4_9ACTN|nr:MULTISPECIES: ornithine cyclodeaminase family protein [Streptomyces]KNE83848.1 ornithine cyclodeaminase [Streptomyces fradiae]OFA55723.1 ornithine cyclodeaminase [Streptomyces fradiae]PQM23923.1 ornithine cyclodeaminase family protein [Streptomyces xinghaiensis]RKM91968.1 ornithine cyclodeaminase family protein [Streptomyces xinghaiensis]RNC73615.1 ornithine cyclodeaminase family protein [Streptomyces xinghaiensis]